MKMKPSHPGEIFLEDVLKPQKISVKKASKEMKISYKLLLKFTKGQYDFSVGLLLKVAMYTKISINSWVNLQIQLDNWKISNKVDEILKGKIK